MNSNKIGLLFPGQGAQYIGMGKELYDTFPAAKEIFDRADQVLDFGLKKIVFEGPDELLRQTQYTQPAIFVASMAAFMTFQSQLKAEFEFIHAGHSLGEYSALCAAGVFSIDDGARLVSARGEFIKQASEKNPGTMAAILGLDRSKVIDVCKEASHIGGVCEAVNFNSPGQVVIAGTAAAIKEALPLAQQMGATGTVALNVSGPFHSSLMEKASTMMEQELAKYSFKDAKVPVIMNVDAREATAAATIKRNLVLQINHPVLWEDSIRHMIELGCRTFIELGPQRILSGLLRRIDRALVSMSIENIKSLRKTMDSLSVATNNATGVDR